MSLPNVKWAMAVACALVIGWVLRGMNDSRSAARARLSRDGGSTAEAAALHAAGERRPLISSGDEEWSSRRELLNALQQPNTVKRNHDLYIAVRKISVAEIPQLIEQAQRLARTDAAELISALAGHWAAEDPRAAAAFADQLPDLYLRSTALEAVLQAWVPSDPEAAMAWVTALPLSGRAGAVKSLSTALARLDGEKALSFLKQFPQTREMRDAYLPVFKELAATRPATAAAEALALPPGGHRDWAVMGVIHRWSRTDPQALFEWTQSIEDAALRGSAFKNALSAWAEQNPGSLIAYVRTMPDGGLKQNMLPAVVRFAAWHNPDAVAELIAAMPPGTAQTEATLTLVQSMSGRDPEAAANYALALPAGSARTDALAVVARDLVRLDPDRALGWVNAIEEEDVRVKTLSSVLYHWAQNEPRAAADYWVKSELLGQPSSFYRFGELAESWARRNPQEMLTWARNLDDPKAREATFPKILGSIAQNDPVQASTLLEKLRGEAHAAAASAVAPHWVARDADSATQWAAALPEQSKQNAFAAMAAQRAKNDTASGAKWLETLPAGSARDAAIGSFTKAIAGADPSGAAAWAVAVGDPGKRASAMEVVARQWLSYDRAAALEWIAGHQEFSPASRKALLETAAELR